MVKRLLLVCILLFAIQGCMQHDISHETFLPGQDLQGPFQEAKQFTVVDLEDGGSFDLSADIVTKTINGVKHTMYGYNGQIPGPVFRVKQDSTITINFKNNIDLNTTIHWHGLRHDINFDGVPHLSQAEIAPGQEFSYEVYFPDAGIYWYHPHVREDIAQEAGLAANMMVMPSSTQFLNPANREQLLVLDDMLIENNSMVAFGKDHANFALMGRFGNTMLVNGDTQYYLEVNRDDVVRFYVTNVANVRPFNLSFGGAKIKLVGSDLSRYEKEEYVESIIIAPAERYVVEVLFENPGEFLIQNNNPHKSYNLGVVKVTNKTSEKNAKSAFNTLQTNQDIVDDINKFRPFFNKSIDYVIALDLESDMDHSAMGHDMDGSSNTMDEMPCHQMPDGSWMGKCDQQQDPDTIEWEDDMNEMNRMSTSKDTRWILRDRVSNKENMDLMMNATVGDVIKIRLFNDPDSMHPMQHPIHLHGQRFIVIEKDKVPNQNMVWKDTVLVPAGSTYDILVDVTNPGTWMIHCHISEHLESGMMAMFHVNRK